MCVKMHDKIMLLQLVVELLVLLLPIGSAAQNHFKKPCEMLTAHGDREFHACLTEPQHLLRSQTVLHWTHITPINGTCGTPATTFCRLDFSNADCDLVCDSDSFSHPSSSALDSAGGSTWWQSVSWLTYPIDLHVTFTMTFKKLYRLTDDLIITFNSGRAREMVVEHSVDHGASWRAWQYFAQDCRARFNMSASDSITKADEILCSQAYSDTIPYSGGMSVFGVVPRYQLFLGSSLNDIGSLYQSYSDLNWQTFLEFTDVKIRLLHPATDGEEVNGGFNLQKYYYAISDISITAECSCNLHASICIIQNNQTVCDCRHNTAGDNCESCLPLYNNRKWMPGSYLPPGEESANECEICQCNGHADECYYNATLGHGICTKCQHNTTGVQCELCIDGFYQDGSYPLNHSMVCSECHCNTLGTINGSVSCDKHGRCDCAGHVRGEKCDMCVTGYYGLETLGRCTACGCSKFGVIPDTNCDEMTGQCMCKNSTTGRTCSYCDQNKYNYPITFEQECEQCDCIAEASWNNSCDLISGQCHCLPHLSGRRCEEIIPGYYIPSHTQNIKEFTTSCEVLYSNLDDLTFTGDHITLCNMGDQLRYHMTSPDQSESRSIAFGLTYSSHNESSIQVELVAADECLQAMSFNDTVALTVNVELSSHALNLSAMLEPGCNYTITIDFIDQYEVIVDSLQSAVDINVTDDAEIISCSDWSDYGQSDMCNADIYSVMAGISGGAKACQCDVSSIAGSTCHPRGGQCQCMPGVKGRKCDSCAPGYHMRSEFGCQACQCDVMGSRHPVCDPVSGQCPCFPRVASSNVMDSFGKINNTRCEVCQFGWYNLSSLAGCQSCDCDVTGSRSQQCNYITGKCHCKGGVGGAYCNECQDSYHNMTNDGCSVCACDPDGSLSNICDKFTGQCLCKDNVAGLKCDTCISGTFGLSQDNAVGCTPCFCNGHQTDCTSASGHFTDSIYFEELSSLSRSTIQTEFVVLPSYQLLSSYGQELSFYVLPPVNITEGSALMFIHSLFENTTLTHKAPHTMPAGVRSRVLVRLTEANWRTSDGESVTLRVFQELLYTGALHIRDITVTSLKMITATDHMTTSAALYRGVENCTCSTQSLTTGLSCDQCVSGTSRITPSDLASSCQTCDCNDRTDGSVQCDQDTGVCLNCRVGVAGPHCELCDNHVTGQECDRCEAGYWNLSTHGCSGCFCHPDGSLNSTCDQMSGMCYCKPGVIGHKCDTCQLNSYNLTRTGCQECHQCYSLVSEEINDLSSWLYNLSQLVESVNETIPEEGLFSTRAAAVSSSFATVLSQLQDTVSMADHIQGEITAWQSELNDDHTQLLVGMLDTLNTTLHEISLNQNTSRDVIQEIGETAAIAESLQSSIAWILVRLNSTDISDDLHILEGLRAEAINQSIRLQSLHDDVSDNLNATKNITDTSQSLIVSISTLLDNLNRTQIELQTLIITANLSANQTLDWIQDFDDWLYNTHDVMDIINSTITPYDLDMTLNSTNEDLRMAAIDYTQIVSIATNYSLNLTTELSDLYSGPVQQLTSSSILLLENVQRHLGTIHSLHVEITASLASINGDKEQIETLHSIMADFSRSLKDLEDHILEALIQISGVHNFSLHAQSIALNLLNFTGEAVTSVLQARNSADQVYARSVDVFQNLQIMKTQLQDLLYAADELKARVDNSSFSSSIVQKAEEMYNNSCVINGEELDTLTSRVALTKLDTELSQEEINLINDQVEIIHNALVNTEALDSENIHDLQAQLTEIVGSDPSLQMDALTNLLEVKVEDQRIRMVIAEKKVEELHAQLKSLEDIL